MSAERLSRALGEQVRRLGLSLGHARRGEGSGVHRARVASRRIREMLPLIEAAQTVPPGPSHWRGARRDIRRLAAALGAVRELDVTRDLLVEAAARHDWRPEILARVRAGIESDWRERHSELIDVLRRVKSPALLRELRNACGDTPRDTGTLNQALDRRRLKRAATLAASLRALGTLYVPERLHDVRLAAKKLRYALEAEGAVRRVAVARDVSALTGIQEHLGQLHDLQIVQGRLRHLSQDSDRNEVRRMTADLERECRAMHAHVVARSPAWLRVADRIRER